MKSTKSFLFMIVLLISLVSVSVSSAQDKPFEGVTVNVVSFTGPQVTEPLLRRGPDFEAETGAHIEVTTVPFAELYNNDPHRPDDRDQQLRCICDVTTMERGLCSGRYPRKPERLCCQRP